ncbi:hypothetical protein X777_14408, partial [Ooceraea biroi]
KCPKSMYVHERWLHACGLNERDDVSRIYICTRHFHPNDFGINNKRIRLHHGAIPSIAVPNPVIEGESHQMQLKIKYVNHQRYDKRAMNIQKR